MVLQKIVPNELQQQIIDQKNPLTNKLNTSNTFTTIRKPPFENDTNNRPQCSHKHIIDYPGKEEEVIMC